MATGVFERELKGILHGEKEVLDRVTKSCSEREKKSYYKITKKPFIVLRAAGSFGIDLVAIRRDISFPIEVKTSSNKVIHFSMGGGRASRQAVELEKECSRAGLVPIYAFRLKNTRGDSWRVYTIKMRKTSGALEALSKHLPRLETTKRGHFVLKWSEGLPLHKFIEYLCN